MCNCKTIYHETLLFAEKYGKFEENNGRKIYIPNNPKQLLIGVIDHGLLLQPTEGKINQDGSFECGRDKGFEHKEFILPSDYECDGCTLQWKWSTSYGEIYSCSDIIINGGSLSKCMGKCLNGGSCFNGKCLCVEGFEGDFCETKKGETSLTWLWVLLTIGILGGAGFACYKNWDKIKIYVDRGRTWLTDKERNNNIIDFENHPNNNDIGNVIEDASKQS